MNDLVPPARALEEFKSGERSIGAILVGCGALSDQDVERILELQREKGARFGEAARTLGLLEQRDIDLALSRQFDYPYLRRGESRVSQSLVAAYEPAHPQVEALRALRSELMLNWFTEDAARKTLAVVSEAVQRVPGFGTLSVLPAGAAPPNPQELLARPSFGVLLERLAEHVDFILIDTPPAAESADAQTVAARARAALFVVRKNCSRLWRLQAIAESVARTRAAVLGAVLNDF